jgi:hypothetical protein
MLLSLSMLNVATLVSPLESLSQAFGAHVF